MSELIYYIRSERVKYRVATGRFRLFADGVSEYTTVSSDVKLYLPTFYALAKNISKRTLEIGKEYEFELTRKIKMHANGKPISVPQYYAIPLVKFERIR